VEIGARALQTGPDTSFGGRGAVSLASGRSSRRALHGAFGSGCRLCGPDLTPASEIGVPSPWPADGPRAVRCTVPSVPAAGFADRPGAGVLPAPDLTPASLLSSPRPQPPPQRCGLSAGHGDGAPFNLRCSRFKCGKKNCNSFLTVTRSIEF